MVEAYDDFPNIALVSTTYKNVGKRTFRLIRSRCSSIGSMRTRDAKAHPYDMWSFQGSSYDWGKDDVQKLTRTSSQPNAMGEMVKGGYGGGIPVVAFWTASVGEAIGHVETLPWTLSIPVKVETDGRVKASITIPVNTLLKPGESYSTSAQFCRGLQRGLLRAAADVVERAAERRVGDSEAFERSLQRELVRVGI